MSPIVKEKTIDSSLAFLSEGYKFISNRCERYKTDIFETRLTFKKVICVRGEEAAKVFYHQDRFTRKGAVPSTTLMLLQDKGSVQTLDGKTHQHRKKMFMALMTQASIEKLVQATIQQWHQRSEEWVNRKKIILQKEVEAILCRASCDWIGLSVSESKAKELTQECVAMIEGSGAIGPRNWWGLWLRRRTEKWGREIIEAVRSNQLRVDEGSPIQIIACHRNLEGKLLDVKVATVELINLLRPTIAIARYVTFAALALYEYPDCQEKILTHEDDYLEFFVHEVRRFYPFFPLIGGHVKQEFEFRNYHFAQNLWVLLDIYGTNRDPRIWTQPDTFNPERFRNWNQSAYNFIPQGGGDYYSGHRCAGEWMTIKLCKTIVKLLTNSISYHVPPQDLSFDLSRIPSLPKSGLMMTDVCKTSGIERR